MAEKLPFASDYMDGMHPAILKRLVETNDLREPGYGFDSCCGAAAEKIRAACKAPGAAVHFIAGGTLTNALAIDACLNSSEGVVAASTGHISLHEAGAIEHDGHKVIELPQERGKLSAAVLERYLSAFFTDKNRVYMTAPKMVYLSQPTEYGTLYSLAELTEIRALCDRFGLLLYVDGARLAYALAAAENDVTLPDLGRLCDLFYIGGTKCGAALGEALVIVRPEICPRILTLMKQHGALLAKGRMMGLQFDALFTDGLYGRIGRPAVEAADRLRHTLKTLGYELYMENPTNQVFVVWETSRLGELGERVEYGFWETLDERRSVIRFATGWSVREEDLDALTGLLEEFRK